MTLVDSLAAMPQPTAPPTRRVAFGLAVLVGGAGSLGLVVAAQDRSDAVETRRRGVAVLEAPANDAPAENYLLVGSDSAQGVDPDDPNAAPSAPPTTSSTAATRS